MDEQKLYAVIKACGGQVRVVEGETLRLEKLAGEPGAEIVFPNVLLLSSDGKIEVGAPCVIGAKVVAEIVKHGRGKKLRVSRFKRKKGWQRTLGHRQSFTMIKVKSIVREG
jgi:large subunit ribosomal protein L21